MKPEDPMDVMFRDADAKGLWFFSPYQQLWFSPGELRAAQADGRFRWGAVNWQLRDPDELIAEKRRAMQQATADFEHACARVERQRAKPHLQNR